MKTIAEANAVISSKLSDVNISPVGTMAFRLVDAPLFSTTSGAGKIFQAASGQHVLTLLRDDHPRLNFYHWSPGTGSRAATLDLRECAPSSDVRIFLSWSPERMQVAVQFPDGRALSADGVASRRSFRVARDGSIMQFGDEGASVTSPRVTIGGRDLMVPTAREIWDETIRAAGALLSAQSEEGFTFDVAASNAVLTGLITGFETYCKYRFVELQAEGVSFDADGLARVALKSGDRPTFVSEFNSAKAGKRAELLRALIIEGQAINFQNFKDAKQAFARTFGMKFDDIGLSEQQLSHISARFGFRHRVVHVSPLLTVLSRVGDPGHPTFAGKPFALETIELLSDFVSKLHAKSLTLRASSSEVGDVPVK